jgi:hypothetical protein
MPSKPAKYPDQKQKRIVARLAAQCQVPVDEMAALFETERAKLAAGAHITKFLDVFATRHILENIRLRALDTPAQITASAEGVEP